MTPTDHCYFDYYQSKEMDKEPPAIGGFLPLETVYSFDPVPQECTEEEARHILGAQGNLWTEYIPSPEQAEYMLFPRATALAEVLWSGAEKLNFVDFQQRLQVFLVLLKKMGVNYHMN
jgi:hexosaminidase